MEITGASQLHQYCPYLLIGIADRTEPNHGLDSGKDVRVSIIHRSPRRERWERINSQFTFNIWRQVEFQGVQMPQGVDLHRAIPQLDASRPDDTIPTEQLQNSSQDPKWSRFERAFDKSYVINF